jgi:type IV fimbrial biogenesis protein FimT
MFQYSGRGCRLRACGVRILLRDVVWFADAVDQLALPSCPQPHEDTPMDTRRTRQHGISAIELLITLGIVVILFGIAMPACSGVFEASRASSARAALLSSYMAAVNGATASGTRAVLCPSRDGNKCLAGPDWSEGWIVFLDSNSDREHQADEPVVSRHGALEGKVRLRSTAGRTRIVIQPSGSNAGSNVSYTICDGRGAAMAETLVLNNHGFLHAGVPTAAAIATACMR